MSLPSRSRKAAPRAAVLYGIPAASSLPLNLNRKWRQILAHPGSSTHRQDGQEEAMEGVGPRGELARGGPIGRKVGRLAGGELLVAERHAHDGGHRLLPDRLMLAILRPDMQRLNAADLVVDRPGYGQGEVDGPAGRKRGRSGFGGGGAHSSPPRSRPGAVPPHGRRSRRRSGRRSAARPVPCPYDAARAEEFPWSGG